MNIKWKLQERQVFMLRPDLDDIAPFILPKGYSILQNTDSLLPGWIALLDKVFGGYTVNRVRYQTDSPNWSPDRVKLIQNSSTIVALSVAWYEEELWPKSGHVIWVAVLPRHQGKNLGRYVLNLALRHFFEEGLCNAVVYTEIDRLAAIKMYLNAGFVPLITGTVLNEIERWRKVSDALGKPELMLKVRNGYAREISGKLK